MKPWFAARLVLRALHSDPSVPSVEWEERIVLLQADDEASAVQLAQDLGRSAEHSYVVESPLPHTVAWRFVNVDRVYSILDDAPRHGTEVFSRFVSAEERETFPPADD